MRTVRLLAQLTRQVAVVQYPSLSKSSVRHVELVPLAERRLLVVLITDTGRVEQRVVEVPASYDDDSIMQLRAVLNACLDGRKLTDVASVVAELPDRVEPRERANAAAVFSVILETLVTRHDEKIIVGGASNLTAADFSQGLREVLEALEEQVVLMRLLGETDDQASVTVRIGAENDVLGLRTASVVAAGYGSVDRPLAKLGVVGPTRMDYPTAMGAVRAVARYTGQILAES
jgi:heat-inducible transcriptional repressor